MMAQTVDELAEILNTMRVENQNNTANFEKLLISMNSKLEMLDEDTEAEDLLKFYVTELKNLVEQNHNDALKSFADVKNILETLHSFNDDLVKNGDLENFSSFVQENFSVYASAISEQKDKLEELYVKFKDDLDGFNVSRQENFADLKEELSVILFNLKSIIENNPSKPLDELVNISGKISENLNIFKNEFRQSVENNLANSSRLTESISEVSDKLSSVEGNLKINSQGNFENIKLLLSNLAEKLSFDIQTSKELNLAKQQESNENIQQVSDNLSGKINELGASLKNNSENNLESVKSLVNEISEKISGDIISQKELNAQNFMANNEHLTQVGNDLSGKIDNINTLVSADVLNVIYSVKDLIASTSKEDVSAIEKHFDKLEEQYFKVVTIEDFANFKTDFADFLQKILDNANILSVNSDIIKDQICGILEKLETLNYSEELENIADRITDFKVSFEDNSKMNYENIINKINSLKDELNSSFVNQSSEECGRFEALNNLLSDLSANINFLKDFSAQKSVDVLDQISSQLGAISSEVKENINNNMRVNIDSIKVSLDGVFNELNGIKENFSQRFDTNVFTISKGFENINNSFDNLFTKFDGLSDTYNDVAGRNYSSLTVNIDDISGKVDELKMVITGIANDYNEKLFQAVKEVAEKLDGFSEFTTINDELVELKDTIISLSVDLQATKEAYLQHVKDISEIQSVELKAVSQNLNDFEAAVMDTVESLKNYISEINSSASDEGFSDKLQEFGTIIEQNADTYTQKIDILQDKLTEFAQIVENGTADTEGKIALSLDEISEIKEQLSALGELVKTLQNSSDEKTSEILCRLETSINSIITNIEASNSLLADGFNSVFKENLITVEDRLGNLLNVLYEIKDASVNDDVIGIIEEKVSELKDELGLVNTDISNTLQQKDEEILNAFDGIKQSIDALNDFDFDKVICEVKTQLEQSFIDLGNNVEGKFQENSETLNRIEQVYKETYNKMNSIEECLTERVQTNIELLNAALQSCSIDIKNTLERKISEYTEELKAKTSEDLSFLKEELSKELASLAELQLSRSDISEEVAQIGAKVKKYITSVGNIIVDKCGSENNKSLINELNEKVEILTDVREKSEERYNALKEIVETLNSKVDIIVSSNNDDEYFARFDELAEAADNINGSVIESKDLLSALHAKVDILASDGSEVDLIEEIDDIKDLIFEQRKYFEVMSEEKDKLAGENAEEINQNIIELQNQVKQLVSSNDDFEYTYTLQDVESDIARLRIAINNISGEEISNFTDDIKKIVNSIENLEDSLTQDQTAELKSDIEKLNDDIVSISSRTNKLLLTSDESYKALTDGLNNFSNIIYKLEDRINYLDNKEISERIESKINNICSMSAETINSNKVFHKVMMYLGEWIDSTTENLADVSRKTSEIQGKLFEKDEIINELKEVLPDNSEIIASVQHRFAQQDKRIDELENKLERILSALEEKNDIVLNRKVDKIEKMLTTLGTNIEKLASYVDEE